MRENEQETLRIQWGDAQRKQCSFSYRLPSMPASNNSALRQSTVMCQ
ncbi:FimD/PapC C-terminal domain-containing protein [Enterobacter cancerogenus]